MNKVRKLDKVNITSYNGVEWEKYDVIIRYDPATNLKVDEHITYKNKYRFYSEWFLDGAKMKIKTLKGANNGICISFNY